MIAAVLCMNCGRLELQCRRRCYPLRHSNGNGTLVHHNNKRKRPLPKQPTDAQPGSEEKIRVLQERLARGEELWHPKDYLGKDEKR